MNCALYAWCEMVWWSAYIGLVLSRISSLSSVGGKSCHKFTRLVWQSIRLSVCKDMSYLFLFQLIWRKTGFPCLKKPFLLSPLFTSSCMFSTDQNSFPIFGCVVCRTHLIPLPIPLLHPLSLPLLWRVPQAWGLVYKSVITLHYPGVS